MDTGEKIALASVIIALLSLIAFVVSNTHQPMPILIPMPMPTPTPTSTSTSTLAPQPSVSVSPEPTPELTLSHMDVGVNAIPEVISSTGEARIFVYAESGNVGVSAANVKISVDGGFFKETYNVIVTGTTNEKGIYSTVWCPGAKRKTRYVFSVEVSKPGYESGYGTEEVFIK